MVDISKGCVEGSVYINSIYVVFEGVVIFTVGVVKGIAYLLPCVASDDIHIGLRVARVWNKWRVLVN